MKKLKDLLCGIEVTEIKGNPDIILEGIHFDSRNIEKNFLFIATRGTKVDGHSFIPVAIDRGATAIVCEEFPEVIPSDVTFVKVGDASATLGFLASAFYGHPSQKLQLVGVTGTNGKTTIASLLYRLFRNLGYKVGLFSTINVIINDEEIPATHTTPDAISLNASLKKMVDLGCSFCFMEVSSHSVAQGRIAGLYYRGGIFTNLTHDHLDYHKTFAEYLKAKKRFFDSLSSNSFALTNCDDKNGLVMLQNTSAIKRTYSLRTLADFNAKVIEHHLDGMLLTINGREVWTHFVGKFNASNLLAVYGAAVLLGQDQEEVLREISNLFPVAGRFETFRSANGIFAIVDYAHTPDALKNVLDGINEIRCGGETLITVVGAGGDRDKTKRPEMAHEAVVSSDKVILTSDNPRSEEPEDIIREMEAGIEAHQKNKVVSIINRREAIRTACMMARPGDIILVAGKGHETYQEIKGIKHHFDDREVLKEVFLTL
ncbi:MAG: UDP-N-acetylmuramoyl-L-alanyl-D-glutamate--2,6-diaminopimelate ligase [Bacteroidota bacterium]|nr:UDP-N-acetylmuramoyl-L-alanyl-D-glutamate--2,6-diaminopimelate ligase [Bacteroidota bacterium]MDP4204698.1 UDP-N-acetylmuramoyl-L-alanyl-D-glutamate--2,6-diaminopimelate ligase [Bacteroidota bacterium]